MIILRHNTFVCLYLLSSANRISNANGGGSPGQGKERNNLQKEILASLFNGAERSGELSGRITKAERRSIVYGEPVVEPPTDFTLENRTDFTDSLQDYDNGKNSFEMNFINEVICIES